MDFGLRDGSSTISLLRQARCASQACLKADGIFSNDRTANWQSSEGQSQGSSGSAQVTPGSWQPTAVLDGQNLVLESLEVEANGVLARFAAGRADDPSDDVIGTFGLPSSGRTSNPSAAVLTVRRLSGMANGLGLYEADPLTGAVIDAGGQTWLPQQQGYLAIALAASQRQGLLLRAQDLPGFGESKSFNTLPLDLSRNYAAVLLINDSETHLLSSYATANPGQANQCMSLITPNRGISFAFEDTLTSNGGDSDFNDTSFTISSALPSLTI